jgi:hypothetical protein
MTRPSCANRLLDPVPYCFLYAGVSQILQKGELSWSVRWWGKDNFRNRPAVNFSVPIEYLVSPSEMESPFHFWLSQRLVAQAVCIQ